MPEDTYKHFYDFDHKQISWSKILLAQRLNQHEDLHLHLVSLTQISSAKLHSVNFYLTDESEPSLVIIARSVFILPTSQNRHSSSSSEAAIILCTYIIFYSQMLVKLILLILPQSLFT